MYNTIILYSTHVLYCSVVPNFTPVCRHFLWELKI